MNHFNIIIGISILLSLVSCEKKPWLEDEYKKVADQINGVYAIYDARWEGEPVDLNNDGKASTDFMQEFSDRIDAGKLYVQEAIYIPDLSPKVLNYIADIPFQKILKNGVVDNSKNPSQVTSRFLGYYTINQKLEIVLEGPMTLLYISDKEYYQDIEYLKSKPVLKLAGNGLLEISFNMTVYDYSTEAWKTAPLTWYYKRCGY